MPTLLGVCLAMLACAAMLITGLATRPAGGLALPTGYRVVHVETYDYGIRMPAAPVPAGDVVFAVTNHGTIPHELVVFKTNHAGAPLPLLKDGSVNEDSDQIESVMDSGSSLAPGETRILTAQLDAGSYVAVCNLPAHYRLGMHTAFSVR